MQNVQMDLLCLFASVHCFQSYQLYLQCFWFDSAVLVCRRRGESDGVHSGVRFAALLIEPINTCDSGVTDQE